MQKSSQSIGRITIKIYIKCSLNILFFTILFQNNIRNRIVILMAIFEYKMESLIVN